MVVIDPEKPLPEHTKLNYEECYAKLILEEFFPERYPCLRLADKPDLQGEQVGVEVTTAKDQKMQEAVRLWCKMGYVNDDQKSRNKARMAQLGVPYEGGVQGWPGQVPSFKLIQKAVESKVQKLQKGNYKPFARYELFVFTETCLVDEVLEKAKAFFYGAYVSSAYKTIYILSESMGTLYQFENEKAECSEFEFKYPLQYDLSSRARTLVEEGEKT